MLHVLKRHPVPIVAHFGHCLVLTYAFPERLLCPLLPPGLQLDTLGDHGFVAVALVQTQRLRPAGWPEWLGQDFFLAGYRIFTRLRTRAGRTLRGLRILRSDTDRSRMSFFGNLLTHYQYRRSTIRCESAEGKLAVTIRTRDKKADLDVSADLASQPSLPEGTVFSNEHDARRFAGPLPYTFDYEQQTHSIIIIKGVRQNWQPRLVAVDVRQNTFLEQEPFRRVTPVLASAFYVSDIPYRWERGVREPLGAGQ